MKISPSLVEACRRNLARNSLPDFACLVDIPTVPLTEEEDEDRFSVMKIDKLTKHHLLICSALQRLESGEIPNLMLLFPPGSAKALDLDTPIPTPDGWKRMGDLRVGDQVFDENGAPCNVTWVSPIWRNRPVYSVTTDCGDSIIADRDHEWLVRLCGKWPVEKIKETHQLHKRRTKRPMITRAKALRLPDVDLPIDPYLLGVWLGDGNSAGLRITSSLEDQPWLRAELGRLGYETKDGGCPTLFGVSGVRKHFVSLGLLHDPAHKTYGRKHIPEAYMRTSERQRLALLQGLIDTDGTVCKKRGSATFCNTNRELAEQVRELIRSLGVKSGWSEGRAMLNGKDCGPVFRVSFYHKFAARMPRKAALCRDQYRTPNTYIDVEPAGIADTVCIEVDSPSHLFLCGRSMTPTHNSTYADVVFIPWFMARKPRRHVILASYASNIAAKQGRRARQLIQSPSFARLMGIGLDPSKSAADEWMLTNGSEYMAGGILSGLTGNRAWLGVLDDPIRGREAAESQVIRDKTWDAYVDDFCSRLVPGAPQVMILTRWHMDDPAGRILPENWDGESGWFDGRDGRRWFVLCCPAIADRKDDPLERAIGETLWPEWFNLAHWEPFKKNFRTWSSLYQQKPTPEEGTFFKKAWFKRYDHRPPHLNVYMTSDHAPNGGVDSDWNVFNVWGVDEHQHLWLLEEFRCQDTFDKAMGIDHDEDGNVRVDPNSGALSLIKRWKPLCWFPEDDATWKASQGFVQAAMRRTKAYCRVEPLSAAGKDKPTKAQPFQAKASMGEVHIPEGLIGDMILDEYKNFPAGRHDDRVDAAAHMGRVLDMAHPAIVPVTSIQRNPVDYRPPADARSEGSAWG